MAVFFLSGFAALVYQVVWQRSLYALFGINVESVTLIVTAFLFGIGAGSLIGGALSRSRNQLFWFSIAEISVGIFGFFSLELFRVLSQSIITAPLPIIALATLALLIVPTILMGMTLPLLVAHEVHRVPETARAVGIFYFVNTAGSAVASAVAVILLLPLLGERGSVTVAALLNLTAGGIVAMRLMRSRA
jgi:predicted membrane-bound spermidine synthase